MRKKVIVVSGGIIDSPEFLKLKIEEAGNPQIICADGAARHLRAVEIVPSIIVGDMDSVDPEALEYFDKAGCDILTYSKDKDKTDTEIALEYAMSLKPDDIWILGALGGRIDHALANISLLVMCAEKGMSARIIDTNCELFIVGESCTINGQKEDTISLIPMSSDVRGITIEGFRYPISNSSMKIGRPYGVSNRLAGITGKISVKSGYLLVIRQFEI